MLFKNYDSVPSKYLVSLQSVFTFIAWREEFNEWLRLIAACLAIIVAIFSMIYYHYKIKLTKELIEGAKQDREQRRATAQKEIKPEDEKE